MARGSQIVRQWKMLRALEAARTGLTVKDLRSAVSEPCSARTIYRDLEQLQEAGFPLVKENANRWRALPPGEGGYVVPLAATEMVSLILMEGLLAPVNGSYLAQPLAELRTRLAAMLTPKGRAYFHELHRTAVASLFAPGLYADRHEQLDAIGEAIIKEQYVRLRYAKPGARAEERVVAPYTIWFHAGRLYLLAWCRRAGGVRSFAAQRILEVEVLDETFEPDPGFDPAVYVRDSFGAFLGHVHHVVIELDPAVAHLVRERRYHHTQRLQERADGGVRLEMEASGIHEMAAWLAGFGGLARPVAPAELVERVAKLHRDGLASLSHAYPPEEAAEPDAS